MYQELLEGGGNGARGLPPIRIGARSSGGAFVPPQANGGGSGSSKHPPARSNGRRTMAGSAVPRGGFMAQRMPAPEMHGSAASSTSFGASDAVEEGGDNAFQVPDVVSCLQYDLICLTYK